MEYEVWRAKNSVFRQDGTLYACHAKGTMQNIIGEGGKTAMSLAAAVLCGIMVDPENFVVFEYKNGTYDKGCIRTLAYRHDGVQTLMDAAIAPMVSGEFVRSVSRLELAPYLDFARQEMVIASLMQKDGSVYDV